MNRSPHPLSTQRPPRVAIALGSGGVRSIAAVGVVEVLRKADIDVDLVVGCSSGALFAAVVAMGWNSELALANATQLWSQDVTEKKRWRAYLELALPRWMGFGPRFAMRDDRLIVERLRAAFGDTRIEDLRVPTRIVTTDAETGRRHVLDRGSLVDALRASMALPFIFPGVEIEGRLLVDGVLSDPLPVSVASDAQIVLAVGFEGAMPRRVDRPSRLVAQSTTALINNLQAARVQAARAAGQTIVPIELRLDRRVGLWETAAMPYLFDVGRQATVDCLQQILELLAHNRRRAHAEGTRPTATPR